MILLMKWNITTIWCHGSCSPSYRTVRFIPVTGDFGELDLSDLDERLSDVKLLSTRIFLTRWVRSIP